MSWLAVPREMIASFGDITRFMARVMGEVYSGRVLRFFGEALRQAGILILGSALVILGLAFILGLTCGIEGAYFSRSVGAPAQAGVFSAWCDLREVMPYAFGYMMSAKVGTGLVAEIGAMRISDEVDALEVMGISSLTFLCSTRLLAAWIVLPFIYIAAVGAGFFASYLAVVHQIGEVSSGGFFLIFWMFQNPPDLLYSLVKGMAMATVIVLVGCYYGYTAKGGPGGRRHGDRQVDGAEHRDGAPRRAWWARRSSGVRTRERRSVAELRPKGENTPRFATPRRRRCALAPPTSARPGAPCATRSPGSRTSCRDCSPPPGRESSASPPSPRAADRGCSRLASSRPFATTWPSAWTRPAAPWPSERSWRRPTACGSRRCCSTPRRTAGCACPTPTSASPAASTGTSAPAAASSGCSPAGGGS